MASRQVTADVRDFISKEEGKIKFAYDDAVFPTRPVRKGERVRGTLTIGVGHTGPDVAVGMTATDEQIGHWLDEDLDVAEAAVDRLVKVPLNDNQFGTLVSFVFNAGVGAFEGSTLLKVLNRGDYDGVSKELPRWNKTTINKKKVVSKGLVSRRAHEVALWNTPAGATVKVDPQKDAPTGTAVPTVPGENWFSRMLNGIFGRKDDQGGQVGGAQPIRRPFTDNINWSVLVTIMPVLLNFLGMNVPDIPEDVEQALVALWTAAGVVITWLISTFLRKQ